jgi:hypothetical protein
MANSDYSRRDFLKNSALAALSGGVLRAGEASSVAAKVPPTVSAPPPTPLTLTDRAVELLWLEPRNILGAEPVNVTWGVPWTRGEQKREAGVSLRTEAGAEVPLQSWPLAYWPDGSLKWTGHAARLSHTGRHVITGGAAAAKIPSALKLTDHADHLEIDTGAIVCRVARKGRDVFSAIERNGRVTAAGGALVCLVDNVPPGGDPASRKQAEFGGSIEKLTVEQSGPLRAVIKLEGRHVPASGGGARAWLPFSLRLYFYGGSEAVRAVHTFIFDGDQHTDFIAALGFRFTVPMTDEWQNRHIRLAGDAGALWGESVRNLPGWAEVFKPKELYARQLAGERIAPLASFDAATREQIESVAAWNDFKLTQLSGTSFAVAKRTNPQSAWLGAGHGERAAGTGYVGGCAGGVAFGVRDFWQRHPSQLEITGALTDAARITLWFWSPDSPAMDLRHYDTKGHSLDVNYEDYEEGHSTPFGVASSHEFQLFALGATPTRERFLELAAQVQVPPLLVCRPERYHAVKAFGVWALPDRRTPTRAKVEAQLDRTLGFYLTEKDRRGWDGYWNYGDFRHRFDQDRHEWRYDVGGYAWDNNEMAPEIWLWLSFLRSGRADIFRMAEALSHHTRDVDMYHIGPFAPFGSRHNVSHWGCGAKEPRISAAALKRPYYYLTADERTGDVMREVVDCDQTLLRLDPMRKYLPKTEYPTHIRGGPDWFAFASNWLAEWERTGDTQYRDRIITGLRDIAAMPHGMCSGPTYGYEPATHRLHHIGDDNYKFLLTILFGGPETVFELFEVVDVPEWTKAWTEFCELYNADKAEQTRRAGRPMDTPFPVWGARLTAFAAKQKNDPVLAKRAWQEFLHGFHHDDIPRYPLQFRNSPGAETLNPGDELPLGETNHAVQWSLNAIELLALVGDQIPDDPGAPW